MTRPGLALLLGVVLLLAAALTAVSFGTVAVPFGDVLGALLGQGDANVVAIVRDLRAPRVVLAMLVGGGLAMSGAALQGALRNPLSEPYLLGVSGGAAVGAVLIMASGATAPNAVTLGAFAGAGGAALLVTTIARTVGGNADSRLLLMAGVIVGAFANAMIVALLADVAPERRMNALWWMMGSAADATWVTVRVLAAAGVVLGGCLLWWGRELDVLALGDEPAASLGVDVDRMARRIFLVASLLAAATVAAAGLIGFVGLIVPNLARALGARLHRRLLWSSAVFGALLLVAADLLARTVRAPTDLPLGAVTALIGVPFFLVRLRRLSRA